VAVIRIDVDGKNATATLSKLRRDFKGLDISIDKTTKRASLFSGAIGKMAIALGGTYIAYRSLKGLFSVSTGFVQTAAQFETFETTLKSITGSSIKAKESMRWITDFTSSTPYQLGQVTNAFIKLKAYGIDPTDDTLKTLGNTASAMGKPLIQAVEAMADAMVGENERLKEFGLRASKMGNKIGYEWTDSSGKTRNIIIENNREIIKSTLNAIFNEKYIGAMDAQSRTWSGIMSNMADKWTIFKKDVMDQGLFNYLKSGAMEVSSTLSGMFDDGLGGAKSFSDFVISWFNNIIAGVGHAVDAVTIFKLGLTTIQTTFATVGYYITLGFQAIADAGASATTAILQTWVSLTNKMGKAWHGFVTWVKQTWNDFIGGIADSSFGKFASDKFGIDFGKLKGDIKPFTAAVVDLKAKGADFSSETTYWGDSMNSGFKEMQKLSGEIGIGAEKAELSIARIKQGVIELGKEDKKNNAEKIRAAEILKKMGVNDGALPTTKSGGGGSGKKSKKSKKSKKITKPTAEMKAYTSTFTSLINDMLSGDWSKAFSGFFDSLSNNIMKPFIEDMSNSISDSLSSALESSGGNGYAVAAILAAKVIGSLFSNEVSQAEIDAAKGQVDFSDDSINNLASAYESVMSPMTKINQDMRRSLRNMDANFYSVARAMGASATAGGIDLTGANSVDTEDSGFLGFSSKSISLIGTGLKFAVTDLGKAMNSAELNVQSYTTKLVKKSSWWGLSKSSRIVESFSDLPPDVIDDMAGAFANGYESIMTSGVALGLNQASLQSALESAKMDIGKIDFTGLSDDEVANRLSQAYSTAFSGVIGGISDLAAYTDRYAKGSEALLETLGRLALEVDQSSHMFTMLGTTFQTLGDYTAQMQQLDIVAATGGIQQFGDAMSAYMGNFFTESEQAAFQTTSMTEAFATFGQELPKTKDGFKDLLNGYDRTTEEGNRLYGQTLLLADGFAQMMDATERLGEEAKNTSKSMLDAWKDLRLGSLSTLRLNEKAALATEAFRTSTDSGDLVSNINSMLETQSRSDSDYYAYRVKESEALARIQKEVKKSENEELIKEMQELRKAVISSGENISSDLSGAIADLRVS